MMWHYQFAIMNALVAFFFLALRNLKDYRRPTTPLPESSPLVSILLPARNEEANIEACLQGILSQEYRQIEVFVLDDCSEDRTREIVERLAQSDSRLHIISGKPIGVGWAGKCHACAQLGALAQGEYLLFMDADTRAEPQLVGSALAVALETQSDLVSGFPRQVVGSFWERVVLPMLQFLIVTLLPVRQVWESSSPALCAACGQFLLFRKEMYERVGGHSAIPGSFHDGLQLARRVKKASGQVRLLDVSGLLRCRMYEGGRAVWSGFTRNAYEGLGSLGALVVMTSALAVLFFLPFLFLVLGLVQGAGWVWFCVVQVCLILLLRTVQATRFGHWGSLLLLPLSILSLIVIQWGSLWVSLRGKGVAWKGRTYAKE